MNRRNLLAAVVSLPVAGALNACRRKPQPPARATLKVILNGPFGVVLQSANDYRITAYVPSDPAHEHELRFRGPTEVAGSETKTGKSATYYFELRGEGLDIDRGSPRIDQGFYDFNFPHIGNWELPKDPFVVVDLPRPDYITFTPPAQPILFGGRPTLQPLDHILEYRMSEPGKVRVKSGDKEEPQPPPTCSELLKQYEEYGSRGGTVNSDNAQLKNIEEMLRSCGPSDRCLLFGVGFDPYQPGLTPEEHGINFFNKVLLPSFLSNVPDLAKPLQKIGTCGQAAGDGLSSPVLMPAVLTYPTFRPRLLQVSSVLDCKIGGVMGTRP